jgi:hypothetical protein
VFPEPVSEPEADLDVESDADPEPDLVTVLVLDPKPDQLVHSFNLLKSGSSKNRPEPQHCSKPVSDPDQTPQITDPARSFGYLRILKLFQVSYNKCVVTPCYAA